MQIPSFLLPANGASTPESVARKRKMAEAMLVGGMDTSPVESPWQAVARVAQAGVGGYSDYKAGQQEAEGRKSAKDEMAKLLAGGANPDNAAIMGAMDNPWISDTQGRMAGALLENNLRQAQPKTTDDITEYEYSQTHPGAAEFWQNLKRSGAPQTNIDLKGQTKYAEKRNEGYAKRANDIEDTEAAAQKSITSLGVMENAMNDPNFYSGSGANVVQALKRATVAMGGDPNQVSSTETFNAFAKQAAIDSMGGSLGTGFSNADRDFVMGQVPTLANTPQGNKSLITINRKVAERKIQIARMMRKYETEHGQLDNGFMDELSQWAEENPMFPQQQPAQQGGNISQFDLMTQPQQGGDGWTTLPNGVRIRQVQ